MRPACLLVIAILAATSCSNSVEPKRKSTLQRSVETIFNYADINGDKYVDQYEWNYYIEEVRNTLADGETKFPPEITEELERDFNDADSDRDKKITVDDLFRVMSEFQRCADVNRNGEVDFSEFDYGNINCKDERVIKVNGEPHAVGKGP